MLFSELEMLRISLLRNVLTSLKALLVVVLEFSIAIATSIGMKRSVEIKRRLTYLIHLHWIQFIMIRHEDSRREGLVGNIITLRASTPVNNVNLILKFTPI